MHWHYFHDGLAILSGEFHYGLTFVNVAIEPEGNQLHGDFDTALLCERDQSGSACLGVVARLGSPGRQSEGHLVESRCLLAHVGSDTVQNEITDPRCWPTRCSKTLCVQQRRQGKPGFHRASSVARAQVIVSSSALKIPTARQAWLLEKASQSEQRPGKFTLGSLHLQLLERTAVYPRCKRKQSQHGGVHVPRACRARSDFEVDPQG
eukprot:SAG31_NODE_4745_length_2985_cov_2.095634_4_plen_207_part_00